MGKAQDKFDGLPVETFQGRFTGTFDIDPSVGTTIAHDDVVCFVVVANANRATISENKVGEIKRTNGFLVTNVKVVNGNMALKILNQTDMEVPGLTPNVPEYHGGEAFIDPDSGDIYGADAAEDDPYWLDDEDTTDSGDDYMEAQVVFSDMPIRDKMPEQPKAADDFTTRTPGATSLGVIRSSDNELNNFLRTGK